jgi:hypothetical protein
MYPVQSVGEKIRQSFVTSRNVAVIVVFVINQRRTTHADCHIRTYRIVRTLSLIVGPPGMMAMAAYGIGYTILYGIVCGFTLGGIVFYADQALARCGEGWKRKRTLGNCSGVIGWRIDIIDK